MSSNFFCVLCLENQVPSDFNFLPCAHGFCRECLRRVPDNRCPLCRTLRTIRISTTAPERRSWTSRYATLFCPDWARSWATKEILLKVFGSSKDLNEHFERFLTCGDYFSSILYINKTLEDELTKKRNFVKISDLRFLRRKKKNHHFFFVVELRV